MFPDVPSRTDIIHHDVVLIDGAKPVKQHAYRMNPERQKYMKQEVQYLLENDFIEPSNSDWSSPTFTVPKANKTEKLQTIEKSMHLPRLIHILYLGLMTALTKLATQSL